MAGPSGSSRIAVYRTDLIFGPAKLAVYLDGCFWHCCPIHDARPKTNTDYRLLKLEANVERAWNTDRPLEGTDWEVIRVSQQEEPVEAAGWIEVRVWA